MPTTGRIGATACAMVFRGFTPVRSGWFTSKQTSRMMNIWFNSLQGRMIIETQTEET